ncbi:HWE histidine kinase domain-containing protein [Pseudorhodoplanes sp.]|uniref:HWE histidine kinase domain-containing protein n=1 Tax=Pseudorhodoplanes sp. TaxID=1934341 RepID=UPI002D06191A|nr:DUF4118 domain-containing protein [Pseudorhodoplanes sp.]HWV52319.1 DUF4118 domain-containing protein [Pseudorhodoplanes sp.]
MGRRLFKKDRSSYTFALVCVGLAALLRTLITYFGGTLYFSTFYPAVLIAALYAGTRAGILATVASMGYAWWAFVPPRYEFALPPFEHIVNLIAFAASSAIVIWVAHIANSATAGFKLARDELAHRNKNTAAVLESILRQSLSKDPEASDAIVARIRALTSADDLVATSGDLHVRLNQLLDIKLKSFDRVHYSGPDITVPPRVARNVSLIVHELTTNAFKYGALSSANGRVNLTWQKRGDTVHFTWDEIGGPTVSAPQRRGFGTRLVTALVSDMAGTATADFRPSGFHLEFSTQVRFAPTAGKTLPRGAELRSG